MHFSVWAPKAKSVELEVDRRRLAMAAAKGGWWTIDLDDVTPAADYAFRLDGGEPLPDPRSGWQPFGVQAPSRLVDHDSFPWTDSRWQASPLSSAVVYEMHVGTFTPAGTFEAAIERLDHLVDVGITHVELMPIVEAPGTYGWGYDGVDLYAPHHAMGGPVGLKRLVDACHARGLAVILDVVYNHLGPRGNYLQRFGPYFTERHHTSWGWAVNFDQAGSDEVRRFFCDNALMWLRDYHFDGLRLDAIHALIDASAMHLLEQLSSEVETLSAALGRHLVLIAESDLNNPRVVTSREVGGYGIDAQWSDDFHHAVHTVLTGETVGYYGDFGSLATVAKALRQAFVYDGCHSAFRKRRHGRAPVGLNGHHFLGYLQTHDQIGNRAQGERIGHLVNRGRLKIGAALVFTSPFIPMIFQGEEWGASSPFQYFTNFDDLELGRAVSEGRRREFAAFGWRAAAVPDPQARETFERSKLVWEEIDKEPHADILDWYKKLIALRRQQPALADGRMENVAVRFDEAARWLTVQRGAITVACNLADQTQGVPLADARPGEVLLCSAAGVQVSADAALLPPDSVVIVGHQPLRAGASESSAVRHSQPQPAHFKARSRSRIR